MKKKFLVLVSILFVFTLSVFGCGSFKLSGGPKATDTVYGNGSVAVVKGDYLYFTNAYLDYNNIGNNDNKYDRNGKMQKNYGIYRTKLNAAGLIELDSNGVPVGAELMVPQVAGYSKGSLYICGDYLYYTTPYSGYKQGESELTKGLLRFERVKLNGSDHTILSEGQFTTDCEYSVNYVDGVSYITILSDEKITVIKSKANGDKSSYVLAEGVSEICVEEQKTLVNGQTVSEVAKYVYYTKTDDDSKYSLYRKSFNGGEEETLIAVTDEVLSLKEIKNGRFYYLEGKVLRSTTFNNDEVVYSETAIDESASSGIVDYAVLEDSLGYAQDRGIIAVYKDSSNYVLTQYFAGSQAPKSIVPSSLDTTKQIDILFVSENEVYFQLADDSKLYAVDFTEQNPSLRIVVNSFETSVTAGESDVEIFDYDNERLFYFSTVEKSNKKLSYLHMALLEGNGFKDTDLNPVGHYIGVLDAEDIVK